MPHDIIDNRNVKLIDYIRTELPGSQAARFAVGYFFLSGLEAVADRLYNVRDLRLLIGNTSNRETVEQIAEGYRRLEQVSDATEALAHPTRTARQSAASATAEVIGATAELLDQNADAERLVAELVRLIETGCLKVKVYTRGRLHAKAYIFDYAPLYDAAGRPVPRNDPGIAVVGSSNFTLSGIDMNTELNVVVHGAGNHEELKRWFEALWDEAEDFDAHLMQELRQAWPLAQVTPYETYLKALYEMVADRLEGDTADEFLWRDDITAVLAEFQEHAVRQAVRMVRKHGGCFVSDVVGLGKSYIGAAVVKHFERTERARSAIICPAPLKSMWERYNAIYDLNAQVLSMGELYEHDDTGAEWMLHDVRYRALDFVLIDESHNFRNTGSQRYHVLESYLATGDRRVVMLTATPRNQSVWDIYNQLHLFHHGDLTDLPIDPPNLRTYFALAEKGQRRLPALLANVLIRRTRQHILRWYGYDAETGARVNPDDFAPYRQGERRAYVMVAGKKQFFPRRKLETISYSIEDTYAGLYDRLRGYLGTAGSGPAGGCADELTYARYGLWNYVRPSKRERPPYSDLQRAGANLKGLMRVMLFKRFESSVHAFRQTVGRLLRIHKAFLIALDQGIVPAGEEAQSLLYEADADEEQALLSALEQVSGRYHTQDFDLERLRSHIEQDIRILGDILRLVEPITMEDDNKLQELIGTLRRPDIASGKRLIFTQYADTAQYLHDALNPGGVDQTLEVIYSTHKSKSEVVARFAPKANPDMPTNGKPEIQTLIATDVLSEGLNLQDCDKVINYDLHWNPVRLIQRFGRIDRIGSEYDSIFAYNFLPERSLERQLGLQARLAARIQEIHDTIGEDAAILQPGERLNEESMYTIYGQGDVGQYEEDGDDEFVDLNEAEEVIRQLRENQPDLYARVTGLRDGVRCARRAGQKGTVVLCRAGNYKQLYQVDERGQVVSRDVPRILSVLKCEPETPAEALPENYGAAVMAVKHQFDREVRERRAEREHTLSLTKGQQYVRRELRLLHAAADSDDLRRQIETLEAAFSQANPRPAVRSELNRIRRDNLEGTSLLVALTRSYTVYGLDAPTSQAEAARDENEELPRIVCSEGLLG